MMHVRKNLAVQVKGTEEVDLHMRTNLIKRISLRDPSLGDSCIVHKHINASDLLNHCLNPLLD